MKRFPLIFCAVTLLMLCACETKKEKEQGIDPTAATIDSLRQALAQSQNETGDLFGTIEEIQAGFQAIKEAEGIISAQTLQGEEANRTTIMQSMSQIKEQLRLNRERIANLREQLRASNQISDKQKKQIEEMVASYTQQLDEKNNEIAELQRQLAEKDIKIAQQSEEITELDENVRGLKASNEEKAATVAAQDKELNTAYYVFGTKKELREQKILHDGDVLKTDDFNKDYLTRIDTRTTKTIRLYSKSARLMTTHPAGSYSLDKDTQGQYTLRISDTAKFWSVSKYLVIVVK